MKILIPYLKALAIAIIYFLLTFSLGFFISITIGEYLVENHPTFFPLINTVVYAIILIVIFIYVKKYAVKKNVYKSNFNFGFLLLVIIAAFSYNILIDPLYNIDLIINHIKYTEKNTIYTIEEIILHFTNTVLFVAIIEELVYRKIMISVLIHKGTFKAILFSSLIFAITHINPSSIDYTILLNSFIIGIISGIIYVKKGLFYSIVFHFFSNLFVLITQTYNQMYWDFINDLNFGIFYWFIIITFLFLLILILFLITRKKKT